MRHLHNLVLRICVRRKPRHAVPAGEDGPEPRPVEGEVVSGVEGLVASGGCQSSPLGHVAVQHSRRLDLLLIPRDVVSREDQRLLHVRLHCGVHAQGVYHVHGGIFYCAQDEGWADDVPLCGVLPAPLEKHVLLEVVEVGLDRDTLLSISIKCDTIDRAGYGLTGSSSWCGVWMGPRWPPYCFNPVCNTNRLGRMEARLSARRQCRRRRPVGHPCQLYCGRGIGTSLPLTSHSSSALDQSD